MNFVGDTEFYSDDDTFMEGENQMSMGMNLVANLVNLVEVKALEVLMTLCMEGLQMK